MELCSQVELSCTIKGEVQMNKRMHHLLALTLVLLLVAGLIVQCGPAPTTAPAEPTQAAAAPTSAPAPTTGAAAKEKVVLKALVRSYSLDIDSPWTLAVNELKSRHPELDIEVQFDGVGYDDLRRKALLTLQAGQGYDIIQVDNIWLGEFVDGGLLLDVSNYFDNWDNKADVPEFFHQTSMWDGKTWGLWLHSDIRTLHWNKELFRQFGLDPEKPPTTWDELAQMAQKCTNPPDTWGYAFPGGQEEATAERWYPFLWQMGGQILSDDNSKATFNSDAGVTALSFLGDLVNKYKVTPPDIASIVYDDLEMLVITGQQYCMGIVVGTGYLTAGTEQYKTPEEYQQVRGATYLPVGPGGQQATGAGGYIMGISTQSQYPDLSWELLTLATDLKNARDYWYGEGRVPTRQSALDDYAAFSKAEAYYDVIAGSVPIAHLSPQVPEYPQFLPYIITAVQQVILGQMDAKQALDQAASQTDALLGQ
jgi:multiple sugar transport system substrate-binding protein